MKKLQKLNTSEKALIELNGMFVSAVRSYHQRTGANLKDAVYEVKRFRDNPEAYEAEENDQEQRRRDLDKCVRDIFREAEILEHLNLQILTYAEKSREDVLLLQKNHKTFCEHLEYILAPVFGVDLDEDEND